MVSGFQGIHFFSINFMAPAPDLIISNLCISWSYFFYNLITPRWYRVEGRRLNMTITLCMNLHLPGVVKDACKECSQTYKSYTNRFSSLEHCCSTPDHRHQRTDLHLLWCLLIFLWTPEPGWDKWFMGVPGWDHQSTLKFSGPWCLEASQHMCKGVTLI